MSKSNMCIIVIYYTFKRILKVLVINYYSWLYLLPWHIFNCFICPPSTMSFVDTPSLSLLFVYTLSSSMISSVDSQHSQQLSDHDAKEKHQPSKFTEKLSKSISEYDLNSSLKVKKSLLSNDFTSVNLSTKLSRIL